jgi:rRNA processing protein Krr1/Pno1
MDTSGDEGCLAETVAAGSGCPAVQPNAHASYSPQQKIPCGDMDSSDDEGSMPEAMAAGDVCGVIQPVASLISSCSPQRKPRWADIDSSDDEGFTLGAVAAMPPQHHERGAWKNGMQLAEAPQADAVHWSSPEGMPDSETQFLPNAKKSPTGVRESIPFPAGFATILIGCNGETARLMQVQTGARIFVDHTNNYARVAGKPEAVTAAIGQIRELIRLSANDLELSAERDSAKEVLMLPDAFGSTLIGPGGRTVNRLQEKTRARIWVEKDRNRARIMGTPDQVSAALSSIQDLLAQTEGKISLCKWYAQGRCHRGAACGFSHDVPLAAHASRRRQESNPGPRIDRPPTQQPTKLCSAEVADADVTRTPLSTAARPYTGGPAKSHR